MSTIPEAALTLIKRFEGYAREIKDGSGRCTAYQEVINGKLDIPTIGFGCTKNVTMGMVWTKQQAEAALLKELASHAERVARLVTVALNEHQRGALISFDYNTGGLTLKGGKPSKVLQAVNAGDFDRAVEELKTWNKFGGKIAKGLVARRAAEIALFLRPTEDVPPEYMPQQPEEPKRRMTTTEKATAAAAAGGVGVTGARAAVEQAKEVKSIAVDARGLLPGIPKGMELPIFGTVGIFAILGVVLYIHGRKS